MVMELIESPSDGIHHGLIFRTLNSPKNGMSVIQVWRRNVRDEEL